MSDLPITSSIYSVQGFLPPDSEEVQSMRMEQYLSLFPVRTGSLYKRSESTSWRPMSQFHSLTDEEIEDSLDNKPAFIRACPMGNKSRFVVLGVPADSIYSNPKRISIIVDLLRNVGLMPVLYGSASCDEIQIYLFFNKETRTKQIIGALNGLLTKCGISIEPEKLVIYDEDVPLALPLQKGFSWLNDSLQPKVCREQISFEAALAMFCADMAKFESPIESLLEFQSHKSSVVDFEIPLVSNEEETVEQFEFTPPAAVGTQEQIFEPIEEPVQLDSAGLVDHILSEDEVQSLQDEQIDFAPEQAIDMSPPPAIETVDVYGDLPKGLPYFSDFTQLTLPIPGAQVIEPAQGIDTSSRKGRRSKRGPPAT